MKSVIGGKIVRWIAPVLWLVTVIVGVAYAAINWAHGQDVGFWGWSTFAMAGVITVTYEFARLFQIVEGLESAVDELDTVLTETLHND